MIQEQRRHQYLDALGVTSWLPRAPLPGARASRDWVWGFRQGENSVGEGDFFDDDVAEAAQEATAAPSAPRPQPSGVGRAALLDSLGADAEARPAAPKPAPQSQPRAPVAPSAAPAPESAAAAAPVPLPPLAPQDIPQFKLAFLRLGDVLLIDSLPPQSRGGLTPAHQRLSMALVRALGLAVEQPPTAQMLPWPAFTSRTLDQGWEQAEAAVQRKLERMLESTSPRFVLLLGETAARLVLRTREAGDGVRGVVFRPRSDLPAIATASLSEMLQVPGCKREVWRDLQPLIGLLADG
ncbi:hypothetical protein GCM10011348_11390 [Marinobacterium nitratireducens]|uniref:Uracil-DNA glycosylase-like domain-containing protein n=1 Tax=Marinobacterium nitratireducens TaxID=518897 RepID=A0A918DQJ5_9GAMM|nr:hypothetical protein [Marinobacterium nitratireducens]GGO78736.1 hypothetical protein GCM10011348_11390 [Marinobacterium nitratireducens]